MAQSRKEYHFNVGPKSVVSVNNPYGSISVKPSSGNSVTINAVLHSDKVEVDNTQIGNRVDVQSHLLPGADVDSGRVDYEILVPADASVTLHSSTGPLHAEKLHGDVTLEGAGATVDVRDITDAHVHVKTLNGPVTLTNVQEGHVEVDSLSGDVTLDRVTGPLVQVISTSGGINYIGDFGERWRIPPHQSQRRHRSDRARKRPPPTSARARCAAKCTTIFLSNPSLTPGSPSKKGSAFMGTMGRAAVSSTVVLRSFNGKIHLRKRSAK